MIALTWWIAAATVVLAIAIGLAAAAFLRRDQHDRQVRTTAQASERHTARAAADIARIVELFEQHLADNAPPPTRVRFEPPEMPAERTQPGGDLPLLCGDDRPVSGRHALTDHTAHMPHVGDLTGGETR